MTMKIDDKEIIDVDWQIGFWPFTSDRFVATLEDYSVREVSKKCWEDWMDGKIRDVSDPEVKQELLDAVDDVLERKKK